MKQLAEIISWIFLPLFMPVYGLLLVMYIPNNQDYLFNEDNLFFLTDSAKYAILYMFFIFSVLAPSLSFIVLRRMNVISTIDMEDKRERLIPMLIMLVYCLLLYFLFIYKAQNNILPKYIYALPLSGIFVTVTFSLINRWIKISLHAGGAGILCGFLFSYGIAQAEFSVWTLMFAIFASGLTLSARLFLQKHSPLEVYSGWGLAMMLTFIINFLYPIS